jgi:hypothetical protein
MERKHPFSHGVDDLRQDDKAIIGEARRWHPIACWPGVRQTRVDLRLRWHRGQSCRLWRWLRLRLRLWLWLRRRMDSAAASGVQPGWCYTPHKARNHACCDR